VTRSVWLVRVGLAVLTSTAMVGTFAAPAQAASAGKVSVKYLNVVWFEAGAGKANNVVFTRSGNTITIDDVVALKPGKGCKRVNSTKVRCTPTKPGRISIAAWLYSKNDKLTNKTDLYTSVSAGSGNDKIYGGTGLDTIGGGSGNDQIWGGGGDDLLAGSDGKDVLHGGPGDDSVQGDAGADVLYGDSGNDSLHGEIGDDKEYGGSGNDILHQYPVHNAKTDADLLSGGSGRDTVDYSDRFKPVSVDLDGAKRDDGEAGEHDTVSADVEDIWGSRVADRLTGSSGANRILGNDGNDVIRGGAGNDLLAGGMGDDLVYGEAGDDYLDTHIDTHGVWDEGTDYLDGGSNATATGDDCVSQDGLDATVDCEYSAIYWPAD
jgi:Ca2+-binding RTX toxin-like protein